jgi:hypothetical protein
MKFQNVKVMKRTVISSLGILLIGCAAVMGVRQQDLDAWVGMPVEALDTHSFFLTVPVYKTRTESGIEIRNYANGSEVARCYSNAGAYGSGKYVNANAFTTCSNDRVVCNNIFYIKEGKVLEYAPTGRCYTDETVIPQARYRNLTGKK